MTKIITCLFAFCLLLNSNAQELTLKYLGAAGWEINNSGEIILIDPYISRLKLDGVSVDKADKRKLFTKSDFYESDTLEIKRVIKKADYILVHHSHFDHLGDVPYIAKMTGAKVIATDVSCKILRAYGIPDEQLYTVKGGEDYQFENFSVRVVPTLHSALNKKLYFDSKKLPDQLNVPLKVEDFIEGGSLMFLIRFASSSLLTMGSMNYIEREVEGLRPDVLLPGVNFSRNEIYKYTERLMKATGFPKTVIPVHWDNYRVPYSFSQEKAINDKIKPFIEEVRQASPASKVIVPVHLETITIPKK